MKRTFFKKILAILLLSPAVAFADYQIVSSKNTPGEIYGDIDQFIEREGYSVAYNYDTKNPDWVAYHLNGHEVQQTRKRKDSFREDERVPSQYRSSLSDYKYSGYDRGHLAPNAALDHSEFTQWETFLLSNIVPQLPGHNRQGWKNLEGLVRSYAMDIESLYVITGVIYDELPEYIGNQVEIPDYFYKILYSPENGEIIAFVIPHEDFGSNDLNSYISTIEVVEKATGYDFFYEG
jgi:endonuclease G